MKQTLQARGETTHAPNEGAWWAQGDAPVRTAEAVVPLVDGRAAMLAICIAFLTAQRSIWLADWDFDANLAMVRGRDQCAGPDDSPEQQALVDRLRAAGLDADALALWSAGKLTPADVLGFAASRGVAVRVLLWSPFDPFGLVHMINNPAVQQRLLAERGVPSRQDKSSRSPFHVAQALHQKCAVVDRRLAFVGGVDLTVAYNGDFDRWDVPAHPYEDAMRRTSRGPAPHPWHDAHLLLVGAPAVDVEQNIRQRWTDAKRTFWHSVTPPVLHLARRLRSGAAQSNMDIRSAGQRAQPTAERSPAEASRPTGAARVQVIRTIPALTYRFAPEGIHGIVQAYLAAVRQAQQYIYLESQYLWLEGYQGLDVWRLGWQSHYMKLLLEELAAAAERGVAVTMVQPDHPNCGRDFTAQTIAWLRAHAPAAEVAGRLHFYCLAASRAGDKPGAAHFRPIYVHAKVGIIDDRWATVGSANLNSRGMSHDAEINAAVLDPTFARGLRLALWAEHVGALTSAHTGWPAPAALPAQQPIQSPALGGLLSVLRETQAGQVIDTDGQMAPTDDLAPLADPLAGLALLASRAAANLERLRRGEPLVGQLLPYLLPNDALAHGLTVDPERGYLDPLSEERGHTQRVKEPFAGRYL